MQAMIAHMLRHHPTNSLGYPKPLNQPMSLLNWKYLKHIHLPAWLTSRTTMLTSSTVLTLMAARKAGFTGAFRSPGMIFIRIYGCNI